MKNLLIIEPHMSGHHGVYLRWIVRGAVERGFRVYLGTLEDSLSHPLFTKMLEECRDTLEIITLPTPVIDYMEDTNTGGLVRRELAYRKLFKRFFNKAQQIFQPDLVFLPYLDYCSYAIAILGLPFKHTPWAGIVMRAAFQYKEMGLIGPKSYLLWPKKELFFRMLQKKTLRTLFTIDPTLNTYMKDKLSVGGEKLRYLPDPANFDGNINKDAARQILQLPKNAVIILVYGKISLRKGLDALLAASANQTSLADVHILLAGKQEPEIRSLLKSHNVKQLLMSDRLHQMNKFISEEEEYLVFKASDIVWLGYREHYTMSGVIVQAGRMGLPVIACKEGVIGWLTKENELGAVIDGLYEKDISEAVKQLMVNSLSLDKYQESGNHYFSGHTIDHFKKIIFDPLF